MNGVEVWIAWMLTALPQSAEDGNETFESRVRPLLVERCGQCHGEDHPRSGLRLDSRAALLQGGERGPAAVPGRPDQSLIVNAVRREGELAMPPKVALSAEEVETLERWIEQGLPWPSTAPSVRADSEADPGTERTFTPEERAFWAFQPLADPAQPAVHDATWPNSDFDRFVLAELEFRGLQPAPSADRRTLLRRMSFDLIGLPPTPQETAAFLADDAPDAVRKVIDRLLDSPQYGERWARHWLDVVRYADSFDARSLHVDNDPGDIGEAWRYRDWVVDALNRDLPYAEFVQDQVAGDLRAAESEPYDASHLIATGLLAIGDWGGGDSDKEKLLTDIVDDQVNVVSRAFLGVTLGCARCHDHKFDPFTQGDYYGLAGIFFSSHILPEVGAKTSGPPMLKIPLASSRELDERARRTACIAELEAQVVTRTGGALLKNVQQDVAGLPGVLALRGQEDTPVVTVNTTDRALPIATLVLPARSVTVHPSPRAGIAVQWTAPGATIVRACGRITDVDSVCGDGVEWTLEHRSRDHLEILAHGALDNGGAMEWGARPDDSRLSLLEVESGDVLRLTILPRGGHECDSTAIDWQLHTVDAAQHWDLTEDLLADAAHGSLANPLPAASGARWCFLDRGAIPKDLLELDAGVADPSLRAALEPALAELQSLRNAEPPPLQYAVGIAEGGVPNTAHAGTHDVSIHLRGRYDRLGALVPRRMPRILAGDVQPPIREGSGRRELAEWLAAPDRALVARVAVNRIFQHHFGHGLVRGNQFGRLGEPPTHPALLDWLARRFQESGGSFKAMHRLLLSSRTYQQSSIPAPATLVDDPENRWLGRMPRTRLEAEPLRDALLLVSGELDPTRGGPASRDPGSRRRALYSMTVRSDRTGFRTLFDGADPTAIVDTRNETLVATQALWFLNSDFVLDRAAALAARLRAETADDSTAIQRCFELLFARPPDAETQAIAQSLLTRGSLEELAHVLLMSNAFLFVD